MSRQTNFTLKFQNGLLPIKIRISKTTEQKTSFKQTFIDSEGTNRIVRTIKVLAKDDASPRVLEDIEAIVPWNSVQSSYPYRDAYGFENLLPIDDLKGKMYAKSDTMSIIGILDASSIKPHMYSGDHYFLEAKADSKSKTIAVPDRQGYSMLLFLCNKYSKCLLTKFISGDREKFATVWADGNNLMLSIIIHQTYQRDAQEIEQVEIPDGDSKAQKLLSAFSLKSLDVEMLQDNYELMLKEYIKEEQERVQEELLNENKTKSDKPKPKPKVKKSLDSDFFDQVDNL